ncbi:MAG: DUF5723 family protein [Candidatus Delongbacteria bacterium]|jgi:hypothetical protein|nr:DUF5723 family protein [Candidatus Delongbacteria bacterium]
MKKKLFIITTLFLLLNLYAGLNNPTAMGSSYSNGLLLKGIDAVRYNPANLGFSTDYRGSINFFPVSVFFENSFSRNIYDDYIADGGDNSWSESDIDDILSQLSDKWRLQNNVNVDLIGFSTHQRAFTLNVQSVVDISFPEAVFELLLRGNEMGEEYDFNDFDAEVMNTASLGYSFAEQVKLDGVKEIFKELSVGATIRYIYAIPTAKMEDLDENSDKDITVAYFKMDNVNAYLDTDDVIDSTSTSEGATTVKGAFDLLTSEGGQGIGIDLGVAAKINKRMNIGLSVTNALAGISWYKNNKIYRYDYEIDGILLTEMDSVGVDSMYTLKDVAETRKFFTVLPPELRLDFTWEFHPGNQRIFWTNSYVQGFKNELLSTTMPKFSTGIQWNHKKADWFVCRAGITGGGDALYSSAIGFSLAFSHYSFDIAVENKYGYGASSKGLGVAVGQKFYW